MLWRYFPLGRGLSLNCCWMVIGCLHIKDVLTWLRMETPRNSLHVPLLISPGQHAPGMLGSSEQGQVLELWVLGLGSGLGLGGGRARVEIYLSCLVTLGRFPQVSAESCPQQPDPHPCGSSSLQPLWSPQLCVPHGLDVQVIVKLLGPGTLDPRL